MQPKFTNGKICILIPLIIMVASISKEKCHFQMLWTCILFVFAEITALWKLKCICKNSNL